MKTKIIFSVIVIITTFFSVNGQPALPDYLIIEKNYSGKANLEKTMKGSENVFFNNISSPVLLQIGAILKDKEINNLHLFIQTESGKLIFEGLTLTNTNINDYSEQFSVLKKSIKGRVIIHSNLVFNDKEGIQLKQKLEEISGLPFDTRNNRNN